MEKEKIKEFAKQYDYADIELLGDWQSYKVYNLIKDKKETSYIGFPLVALVKDAGIRFSTREESLEILDYFNPPTEEEKKNFI